MFNVTQTNNALLRGNLYRMEMLYNTSQRKLSELENKYTACANALTQYMQAFTSNVINSSAHFTYTLPESAKWQTQRLSVSSARLVSIITRTPTINDQTIDSIEYHIIFSFDSPMRYITSSNSSTIPQKKVIHEMDFNYENTLTIEESDIIDGIMNCRRINGAAFEIFAPSTVLYVTKQTEQTTTNKLTGVTTFTTTCSLGNTDEIPIFFIESSGDDYASTCGVIVPDKITFIPKLKNI